MTRNFLDLLDHSPETLRAILNASADMKAARAKDRAAAPRPLAGKTLAMMIDSMFSARSWAARRSC
jgi:ornithine carbamoyltransferase